MAKNPKPVAKKHGYTGLKRLKRAALRIELDSDTAGYQEEIRKQGFEGREPLLDLNEPLVSMHTLVQEGARDLKAKELQAKIAAAPSRIMERYRGKGARVQKAEAKVIEEAIAFVHIRECCYKPASLVEAVTQLEKARKGGSNGKR